MAGREGGQVAGLPAFWDTSALVPLCVREARTPRVLPLYKAHPVVAWWKTRVEIASALARLMRMRRIAPADYAKARSFADQLSNSWFLIEPVEIIHRRALQLVDQYDLRAADSFQLAAALEWCGDAPHGRVFLSADERLREAALLRGFTAPLI